jgi:hypothetical protein
MGKREEGKKEGRKEGKPWYISDTQYVPSKWSFDSKVKQELSPL